MGRKVIVKLKGVIKERGLSIRELSRMTDIRHAALSELSQNKRQRISFDHIEKIADALDIRDIREIIDLEDN
ncbi:helix-turn-helix domain-containing protein [Marinicrinis sediminis]|uniref:Helix-turn-helix domain-containing protein n=1 Tax=Marinicrinis sediminis TaxID=1652465 RepID=A0ABW5R700_9BACL